MIKKIFVLLFCCQTIFVWAQIPQPIKQLLNEPYMEGALFSFIAREVETGETLYSYDINRGVTPASVLKTVTTAAALELLGEDYRFPTVLEYDGEIKEGILFGNLYIRGSGDPTLGSSHFATDRNTYTHRQNTFIPQWIAAVKAAGIKKITGSVISDESIFDTEGISPKWVWEDLGSYYGAASYGLNVFDNIHQVYLSTGVVGGKPVIKGGEPEINSVRYHNYLKSAMISTDSSFVLGAPFSLDRYLYGAVPANRTHYTLRGDIPEPALFLAEYLAKALDNAGITIEKDPSCFRIASEEGIWEPGERHLIITTYSPNLKEIVRIANERSHNLYTDAILKRLGLQYVSGAGEVISSFGKGVKVVQEYWKKKGFDISSLCMFDGSGLASADKVSAAFMGEFLIYMMTASPASEAFVSSLPKAGLEGSVRNFLKGTSLHGKALLKSGGMNRVRCYAGYITKDGKQYAVALFANNYSCEGRDIIRALEKLLMHLF